MDSPERFCATDAGTDASIIERDVLKNVRHELCVFDFLSIDIDGNDYHAWHAIKNYQPKILMIEFNPTIPP
jgi:hypothetical protein